MLIYLIEDQGITSSSSSWSLVYLLIETCVILFAIALISSDAFFVSSIRPHIKNTSNRTTKEVTPDYNDQSPNINTKIEEKTNYTPPPPRQREKNNNNQKTENNISENIGIIKLNDILYYVTNI